MTLTAKLGIDYPIIQAPMAGVTTPEFVAASAEAGMLGSIAAGYLSANETRDFIRGVKNLTGLSLAVNLFVPEHNEWNQETMRNAYGALQPIGEKLGLRCWKVPLSESEFDGQIQVLIDENVKVCSFTFGLPDKETVRLLKSNHVFLIGTATTVEEAILVEKAGLDAVVAQGSEAGGHRGSFSGELTFIPLAELIRGIVTAVQIPVIAAGGIANKKGMDEALAAGAQAVQIGTALLAANESGASAVYKRAILKAGEGSTDFTTAFSGKTARGIRNLFMDEMKDQVIAPYPHQNDLTKAIRRVAESIENAEYISLWAGGNVHLTRVGTVREIVKNFME